MGLAAAALPGCERFTACVRCSGGGALRPPCVARRAVTPGAGNATCALGELGTAPSPALHASGDGVTPMSNS